MQWTKKAAVVASLAAVFAFPPTASADQGIKIECDSHDVRIQVGPIDIHLSGDFNCDEHNHVG